MATYGKQQPLPQLNGQSPCASSLLQLTSIGFDSTRAFSDASFPYFHTLPLAPAPYASRPTYDDQSGPFLSVGTAPTPEVTSYTPSRGLPGTKVFVFITTLYELVGTPVFFLIFGHHKGLAAATKVSQPGGGVCQYQIVADAPPHGTTGWSTPEVPLRVLLETGDGDTTAKLDVGPFTYGDAADADPKKKLSAGSPELARSPRRIHALPLRTREDYSAFTYDAAYQPYVPSEAYAGQFAQYARGTYQSQRNLSFSYPSSTASSSPTVTARSPGWNPSYGTATHRGSGASGLLSPPPTANPPLIRTTILNQPAGGPHDGPGRTPFGKEPAVLELRGDLNAMARGWTADEGESRRRLVHFRRTQNGRFVTAHFQPVAADERPPLSLCISCIYWEEREECFVTSVDVILLLEHLVGGRFSVEEKNRIRRNLEGYRPLTVSKGKAESEDFFKVIMAFPAPKPRNIEKDVKVFRWKDLANSLKKIISKYVSLTFLSCVPLSFCLAPLLLFSSLLPLPSPTSPSPPPSQLTPNPSAQLPPPPTPPPTITPPRSPRASLRRRPGTTNPTPSAPPPPPPGTCPTTSRRAAVPRRSPRAACRCRPVRRCPGYDAGCVLAVHSPLMRFHHDASTLGKIPPRDARTGVHGPDRGVRHVGGCG
jgi:hypothetical protein